MCANVQGGQYLKVWYQICHKIEGLFLYNISSINFHLLSVEIVHLSAGTVDGTWVISFYSAGNKAKLGYELSCL